MQKDDVIYRQAAIDAAVEAADEWDGGYSRSREEMITMKLRMLPSAQSERWDTCFSCPLSHGCPVINGCINNQAEQYAGEIPTDCPLDKESAQTNLDRIYAELSRAYNVPGLPDEAIGIIGDLMVSLDEPPIQPTEEFQWCDDCKEYDKKRHCCPRWNRVIRQTVEELNGHQAEEMEKYRNYQIEWLTSHNDLELDPVVEGLVVRFLTDTAEMYKTERGTYEAD